VTAPPAEGSAGQDSLSLDRLRREVDVYTFRAGGPGGQHRNKTESAVRLVHRPTGLTVIAADHRHQGANRELALERLLARLRERGKKRRPRRPTRASRASVERRLDQKKRRSQQKSLRRRMSGS
jgi:protein subunit release factor A